VVTIAALYGAGGDVIGSRVAERLGVPCFDRAIIDEAARRTGLPEHYLDEVDEQPRTFRQRLVANIGRASTITGGEMQRLDMDDRDLRRAVEEVLAGVGTSGGVLVGRGGMVVLRAVPWALHVHLTGPVEARIARVMTVERVERADAERRLQREDRARVEYLRSAYGVDGRDPRLYHLVVDSTALDLDVCVDLIVTASRARSRHPRATPAI
jgi:cytidylate kinase